MINIPWGTFYGFPREFDIFPDECFENWLIRKFVHIDLVNEISIEDCEIWEELS